MARKAFDPLHIIPSPDMIRAELEETETLAQRLRVLLDLAEKLRLPLTTAEAISSPGGRVEVARG